MFGKKCEVKVLGRTSPLTVWANPGNLDVIKGVAGVSNAFSETEPTRYTVFIDGRYDPEYVALAIENALLRH